MKKDEMTEKNEMLLHELDGLVNDIKEGIWSGGDELEQVAQSIQTEMEHVETVLDKLAQEMAVSRTGIQELAAREAESQAGLREQTDQGNGCLPAVEAAYKTVLEDQVQLAVAKERDFYLQRNYGELQARLAELRERKSQMAALTSRMGRLVDNVRCMVELADKVQALVQSQSFGFKVIMAQEEERRRVAREMHDGPAQAMANVIFLAEVCEKLIELDTGRAKEELHELRQQILGCLNETRKIIFDLRPMALDDLGLIPTVKRIADILKERKGIKVSVKPLGHAEKLESHIEIGLFRIIQESLNNIEKHAEASEVEILIEFQSDWVAAEIKDNGKGFEADKNHYEGDSFGLLGMRERVSLLDGELVIHSRPGEGTEVRVRIPLSAATREAKQLA